MYKNGLLPAFWVFWGKWFLALERFWGMVFALAKIWGEKGCDFVLKCFGM